jgi:hypothetical protein
MIRIPSRLALVTIVTLVASAGCGQGKPATGSDQKSGAPPSAAPSSRSKQNACALVNLAEIEAIAKKKLSMLHNIQDEEQSACELSDASNAALTLVTVTVHWVGGKELARINQAAMSMGKQLLNDDDVNIEEITGSKKVRGLADKAYYSDLMPSWVLKNDVLIEMISPLFNHAQTKAVFVSVSKTALPRL